MKFRYAKAKSDSVEPSELAIDLEMWDKVNLYCKDKSLLYCYIQLTDEGICIEYGGTSVTVTKDSFIVRNEL